MVRNQLKSDEPNPFDDKSMIVRDKRNRMTRSATFSAHFGHDRLASSLPRTLRARRICTLLAKMIGCKCDFQLYPVTIFEKDRVVAGTVFGKSQGGSRTRISLDCDRRSR